MQRIRSWLYVGKYRDTGSPVLLSSYQISAMLQLADPLPQPGIASLYLPVEDGVPLSPEQLRRGLDFVRLHKADGHRILVACGAGISRSVTFAIAALKEEEGLSLLESYRQILDSHPQALPHPALWESLRVYYGETLAFQDVWEALQKLKKT